MPSRDNHRCEPQPTVDPSSPGIARKARRYEMKLRKALAIAARRYSSGDLRITKIYAGATVEGVDLKLRMKKATVTFSTAPFRGGYHQIYGWATVEENTVLELAEMIDCSLREMLRWSDKRRYPFCRTLLARIASAQGSSRPILETRPRLFPARMWRPLLAPVQPLPPRRISPT
jgi:hypothetical protein